MADMKPWKRIGPTAVDTISYRTIVTKTFEMPDGEAVTFGTIWPEGQQFVATIALTKDKQVIIARMFRVGPEKVMDELPGGYIDPDESIEAAGRRELREETGYQAGTTEYLGKTYKDAYMNGEWHYILAADCVYDPDKAHVREAEEHIETRLISIDELISNAKEGKTTDGVGILLAYDKLKEIADD
jgi:ADP-ribose pyrophosphatase